MMTIKIKDMEERFYNFKRESDEYQKYGEIGNRIFDLELAITRLVTEAEIFVIKQKVAQNG